MSSPLRQRETVFVVIGTRRCVRTTAVLHASSREYGPPRVVSQRSEEYELSMNPTVSYPIVFFLFNKLSVTRMPMRFTDLTLLPILDIFFNDAPVYSIKSLAAFKRTVHRALARPVLQEPYLVQQARLS